MIEIIVLGGSGVIVVSFSYMFYSRHRSRHTIALHRHPENTRRLRSESVEDTMGWYLKKEDNVER